MNTEVNTPAPVVGAEATKPVQQATAPQAPAPVVGAEATKPVQQEVAPQASAQTDKATRFKNRAENQASKVMAEIEKLQKLSNKKYYTYTQEQVNEVFAAIQTALDEAQANFTSDSPEKKKLFTFSA